MAVAFVQKSTQLYADNATSIAPSLAGCTAGNHVEMEVGIANGDTTSPANAVGTPTGGWSVAIAPVGPTGAGSFKPAAAIFYKENIAGGTHSGTITMVTGSYARANITEHSGVATSGSLDVTASNTSTGATSGDTGTTATTANADSIAVCTGTAENGSSVTNFSSPASAGWTVIDTTPDNSFHVCGDQSRKILSSTGTQSGLWTWTTSAPFAGVIAIFKGATAAAAPVSGLQIPYPFRPLGERTGRGSMIMRALFPPARIASPDTALVLASAGAAQAAAQAAGSTTLVLSAVAQAASQAAGGTTQVVLGAAQSSSQAATGPVVVALGGSQIYAQSAGGVIESVAGSAQAASQSAGSVVTIAAGAGQSAGQASASAVEVVGGVAGANSQAVSGAVEVVIGVAQSASQAAGSYTTGSTAAASGEAQAASQAAGGPLGASAGQASGASQASGGVTEGAIGVAQAASQAAGVAPITIIAAGVSASYAQAEGALPAVAQGGGGWGSERAKVRKRVNELNRRILEAEALAEAQENTQAVTKAKSVKKSADQGFDEDEEEALLLLL